jgi:Tol biopolymer transport system component
MDFFLNKIINLKKCLFYLLLINFIYCNTLIQRKSNLKEIEFDYKNISENYFTPENDKPFPLTVQKGNNIHNSTTRDGKYLYFSTDNKGSYDIWLRDVKSSIVVPITNHPSAEYKPSISPDGKYMVYVSEEEDSNGDLILAKINSSDIIKENLEGKVSTLEDKINLTNKDSKDRYIDTDPSFSPDGNQIIFTSNRLTPSETNIVLMDIINPVNIYRVSEGGASSPSFSLDGSKITFVSYKNNKNGDIVIIDIKTGEEKFITKDKFPNFSPTFSSENDYIYFSSIREDSNKDGIIDEKDISRIVKKNIVTEKEYILTPNSYSSFDSKYSNFNGGSIVYSASIYNAINIYFIPLNGFIPQKLTPQKQYLLIREYLKSETHSLFELAQDSMSLYFYNHELIDIFLAKVESLKLELYSNNRKSKELNEELSKTLKDNSKNSYNLYKLALAYSFKFNTTNKSFIKEMETINQEFNKLNNSKQTYGSFLELYADMKYKTNNISDSIKLYYKILDEIPEYYNSNYVKLKMGDIVFSSTSKKIPEIYLNLIEENISLEDKVQVFIDIESDIKSLKNSSQKIKHCEELIEQNNLKERSPELYSLVSYIKAESLSEIKDFQNSNLLLNEITKPIPVIDPICAFTPGCKQKMPCEEDRICLKVHLLKAKNFENMGNVNGFFEELKIFFQGYDGNLKVYIDKSEVEKNFRYFEIKAREYESIGKLRESALNFFYNTENMYLLKEKNIHVNTIYKELGAYYYKKMVDSIIVYAKKQAEEEKDSIINKINILSDDKINISGTVNNLFSYIPENRITKNLKSNLKIDLNVDFILGKPGKADDALKLIEQHFNLARPRSRPVLYLSSLYGYAYYQIEKFIVYDEYYRNKGNLTYKNKEKILEGLKIAEYELKWIIFANQEYSDAYQLLGYLYQYIDLSKQRKLNDEETEGEFFVELYEKYFPGKNIEKNIDLYKQIITFLGKDINEKVESDIHLNLGNTYLYLNNYQKANENYKKVNDLSKNILKEVQFNNYKQEAIFRYNFSRSLIYNSEFENAKNELIKLIKLYENYESGRNNKDEKLTIIYSLLGFVYSEINDNENAIKYFKKSLALNIDNQFIPTLSLYNSLSYNYIKNKEYKLALHYIQLARKEYNSEDNFKFSTKGMNIWNIILPENLRTIGDSNITGVLSKDLQFLWTSGNELDIYIETQDLNKAIVVINEREEFLKKSAFENKSIGIKILLNDKRLLGYLYNKFNYYTKSDIVYTSLITELPEELNIRSDYLNNLLLINDNSDLYLENLYKNINFLNKFKNTNINKCEFILKNNIEVCELEFTKNNKFFINLLGNIYYKLYLIFKEKKNDELSIYYFSLYRENYNFDEISNDNKLGSIDKVRLLINSTFGLNKEDEINKIENLKIIIKENNLNDENFILNNLLIEYYLNKKDYSKIESCISENKNLLNYIVFSNIVNDLEIERFFDLVINYFFNKTQYQKIPLYEELKLRSLTIRSFLKTSFKFQNERLQEDYKTFQGEYFDFIKNNSLLRSKQNNFSRISKKEFDINYYKLNEMIIKFINKNKIFSNILDLGLSGAEFKSYSILTLVNNNVLFINKNNTLIFNEFEFTSEKLENEFKKDKNINLISYIKLNQKNIELLSTVNSLRFKNLQFTLNFNQDKNDSISDYINLSEENTRFNSNFLILKNSENNSENNFNYSDSKIKDLFEKNNLYSSLVFSQINDYSYNYIYKLLSIKPFYKIYFYDDKNQEIISSGIKNNLSNTNSSYNFESLISSVYKKESINDLESCINLLKVIRINKLNPKEREIFDIVSLRIFSKYFSHNDKLFYYKEYLSKEIDLDKNIKIRYHMIKYCFFHLNLSVCKNEINEFNKNLLVSKINFNDKAKYKYNINFYISYIQNFSLFQGEALEISKDETEDELLFSINNIKFFTKYYYFNEAKNLIYKISKNQLSKDEIKLIDDLTNYIGIISELSGINKINYKFENKDNIYSYIINRNYNKIIEYINILKNKTDLDIITDYKIKLYTTYYKLEIGENYNPINLASERLATKESLYSILDERDRLIIYYILSKSILIQTDNEINNMFNQLIDPINLLNPRIISYMIIGYSENAFQRGDIQSSEYYIKLFDKSYSNNINDPDLKSRIENLKFKLEYIKSGKITLINNNKYLELFKDIYNSKGDVYKLFTEFLSKNSVNKFSSTDKKEILDLIFLLQKYSLDLDSSNMFFDLGIFKDKLSILNERFYDNIYFKDLPKLTNISYELENKIPENQSFVGLFQYGLDLIKIKFYDKKSNGRIVLSDSRILRNDIFTYYNTINSTGSSPILRESLETKFRKYLLLDKKKRSYVYLSSYLQKTPLELREDDNFFIVNNPELMTKNPEKKYLEYFNNNYNIKYFNNNYNIKYINNFNNDNKLLSRLEKIEIPEKNGNENNIYYIQDKITLEDLNKIYVNATPILLNMNKTSIYNGPWIISNSNLYSTSFLKDDLISSIQLYENKFTGPYIFSVGPQYSETDKILFFREYLMKSDIPINIKSRYINAIKALKYSDRKELSYIGYRLSTNCFLVD